MEKDKNTMKNLEENLSMSSSASKPSEYYELNEEDKDIGRRSSCSRLSEEDEDAAAEAKFERYLEMLAESEANRVYEPRTPMDIRGLCANQGLELVKSQTGISYEYVEPATQHIPVFSIEFGYGIHLNFFARQQTGPSTSSLPELMFLEFTFGDLVEVVRCVPLGDQKYPYPHENECVCFHPDGDEPCGYCEHAKDGSLTRNYALPPPYPIPFP